MTDLLKKLNYRDHDPVVLLNAPPEFAPIIEALETTATVHRTLGRTKSFAFAITFATQQREVDAAIKALAPKPDGDAVLWIAYPKGTSKRYTCDFNRDTGWTAVGNAGFEPVRQVAIDEDWSVLRFRKVAFIKKMTRNFAMTKQGKAKVASRK